jgi:ZIP family zinc transporter
MVHMPENLGLALILTTLAGLSTGLGSAIAYFIKEPKMHYLAFSLGFSAGVMIYISLVELMPEAIGAVGETRCFVAFFIGILLIGLIDLFIPEPHNPHHFNAPCQASDVRKDETLMRTGVFTALAIGIHNFPEGLAAFGVALTDIKLGITTAIAIAIHNIPEGISVSVPILYATGSKNKAFTYSFLSGLSEPIGAIAGFFILMPFLSKELLTCLLAFVAGIMVYTAIDELLPVAYRYGHGHTVILGVSCGMFIMGLGLLLF